MAWEYWLPVTTGTPTDLGLREFIDEPYRAADERERANTLSGGIPHFPRGNAVWETGVVTGITATTLTDSTKTWDANRWIGYDPGPPANIWTPRDYDVIFDSCSDSKIIVRAQLSTNAAGSGTVNMTSIAQYVTERVIPNIASLIGRRYVFIKRFGLWWNERRPQAISSIPKDQGKATATTAGTITETRKYWATNQWVGKDVLYMGAGGTLQRGSITANTHNQLTFTGTTQQIVVGEDYFILTADARFRWDYKDADSPYAWYTGVQDRYLSHNADDVLAPGAPFPTQSVTIEEGSGGNPCESTTHPLYDADFWSDIQEECSPADKPYNPDLFKSMPRGMQAHLEAICVGFVEDRDYAGWHSPSVDNFCLATFLYKAGINPMTGTTGACSGGNLPVTLSPAPPWTPIEVQYAIMDPHNENILQCGTAIYDGTKLLGVGCESDYYYSGTGPWDGKPVRASLGWTRWVPREFRRLYDATAFIPDADSETSLPADPPTEDAPGTWETRAKSTHYIERDERGFVSDGTEARDEFANGHIARFVGTDYFDPNIEPLSTDDTDPWVPYYDNFVVAEPAWTITRYDELRGRASAGTSSQLRDDAKSWVSVMTSHTGTATSGSTTTLRDTTQVGSAFWDGTRGRWVGFILQIDTGVLDENGDDIWERRPITAYDDATQTITVSPAFSVTAGGKEYALNEPGGKLNRWKGRALRIWRKTDNSLHTIIITNSDSDTLYFAEQAFAVAEGDLFEIIDPTPGTVWKRQSGAWVKPSGTDGRTGSGGVSFVVDQTANAPDKVKRYGKYMNGDIVATAGLPLFKEIYDGMNVLTATQGGADWQMLDPYAINTHCVDQYGDFDHTTKTCEELRSDLFGFIDSQWGMSYDYCAGNVPNAAPGSNANVGGGCGYPYADSLYEIAGKAATFNYPHTDGTPNGGVCPQSCAVDFYGWFQFDAGDGTPGYPTPQHHIVFDASDSGVAGAAWHRLAKLGSSGASTAEERFGPKIGSGNPPATPANTDCCNVGEDVGYYIANTFCIRRWKVSGGMVYTA